MRASAIEFRLRMLINAAIIVLGFWAPWSGFWGIGRRIPLIEWLAFQISRLGIASFGAAQRISSSLLRFFAAAGVFFRVWGTTYLGPGTVNSVDMLAGKMMADGPYRYLRNPLYVGLWCMVAAMAFLMPATGAVFAVVLITVFLIRLTLGEEAFLAVAARPALSGLSARSSAIPSAPSRRSRTCSRKTELAAPPLWRKLTPIGVFVAIVVFSWSYDLAIAVRVILVFFGASLIVRAVHARGSGQL